MRMVTALNVKEGLKGDYMNRIFELEKAMCTCFDYLFNDVDSLQFVPVKWDITHCLFVSLNRSAQVFEIIKLVTDEPTQDKNGFIPDIAYSYYPVRICSFPRDKCDDAIELFESIVSCAP